MSDFLTQNAGAEGVEALPSALDLANAIEQSKNLANAEKKLVLSSEYIQLKKVGTSFRGVFLGLGTMRVKAEGETEPRTIPCARFAKDGKVVINGGASLVNQFDGGVVPIGAMVEVEYVKKDGDVKVYEVSLLG